VILSPKKIKQLCKQFKIKPKKYLGQNFLIDKFALRKIIRCANLSKEDVVLEIGAGLGTLTYELAKQAKRVIAIEKDKAFIPILQEILKDYKNIELIEGDFRKISLDKLGLKKHHYKVVANLPFSSATFIIRKLLEDKICPKEITCLVQKEVAQKICSKKTNILSLSVQFYGKPKICGFVSKKAFWPKPKVDTVILKIENIQAFSLGIKPEQFFKIIKLGFSSPRKSLLNNLSKEIPKEKIMQILSELSLSHKVRPSELSITDWISLIKKL